ncbi:MAG TPA: hypothetical protein VJW20_08805 [Candidatus Angelobacter sp.]|nr:hypothetical protein [Candidatus Angelobacter sp.]
MSILLKVPGYQVVVMDDSVWKEFPDENIGPSGNNRMPPLLYLHNTRKRALDVGARAYFSNVSNTGKFLAAIASVRAGPTC